MHSTPAESTSRTQLRTTVTSIEQQLADLSREPAISGGIDQIVVKLRSSWNLLVQLLALGPEPEVRQCPTCKHSVRRAASLCGYCWTKLEPLAAQGEPVVLTQVD